MAGLTSCSDAWATDDPYPVGSVARPASGRPRPTTEEAIAVRADVVWLRGRDTRDSEEDR